MQTEFISILGPIIRILDNLCMWTHNEFVKNLECNKIINKFERYKGDIRRYSKTKTY